MKFDTRIEKIQRFENLQITSRASVASLASTYFSGNQNFWYVRYLDDSRTVTNVFFLKVFLDSLSPNTQTRGY